ncbi:MAG TPA: hypothetical protein VFK01_14360 [Bradyrhizobium sp.]|nr:hypothetical protein [Bradyrhizobium sp.]
MRQRTQYAPGDRQGVEGESPSIKWVGTHKDYDKINVKEVQYGR